MPVVSIVIDDSTNKVITGTYEFDRASGGTMKLPAASSHPGTPVAGETYWNTTDNIIYRRNDGDTAWVAIASGVHASTHENGGADEISVSGLSGLLADGQTPLSHASSHEPGGSDTMAVDAVVGTGSLRTLGTGAQQACAGNDSRLSDARTPTSHASSHQSGGGDAIKLDDLASPDDNTDLDATIAQHGLLPKLGGGTTNYLRADGAWAAPPGGGGGYPFSVITVDPTDSDADYSTIAAAISAASNGDTILIGPGYYDETITLGKGLSFVGMGSNNPDVADGVIIRETVSQAQGDTTLLTYTYSGTSRFKNCTFKMANEDSITSGLDLKLIDHNSTGSLYFYNCKFYVSDTAYPSSGTFYGIDQSSGGYTKLYHCYMDMSGSPSVTEAAVYVGGSTACDTLLVDCELEDGNKGIIANNANSNINIQSCFIKKKVEITSASTCEIWGGTRLDTTPSGTITWKDYGMYHKDIAGEVNALQGKTQAVAADVMLIEDSEDSWNKKKLTLDGITDYYAIHDNITSEISAITEKTTPVGADLILIEDSAGLYAKKKVQITNLPGGADADAIHDNVSGEINAITEKTTPVGADLLLIEDSAASNAKKKVQITNLPGGGGGIIPHKMFQADQMESPNSSDWTVNVLAPLIPDASNAALSVRAFDDSADEGIGFTVRVPTDTTNMILGFLGRAATAPGSTKVVCLDLYSRAIPDNAVIPSWSSATSLTNISIPTNAYFQKDSQTITISTLGLTAGVTYLFELCRDANDAADTLVGDWLLHSLTVGWS